MKHAFGNQGAFMSPERQFVFLIFVGKQVRGIQVFHGIVVFSENGISVRVRYLIRISIQENLNGYPVSFHVTSGLCHIMLLPVTGVVVRRSNASYHESRIFVNILSVGVKVDAELVVHSFEEALVWHACLEQRNVHA